MYSTHLKSLHIARALVPIAAALVLISLGATPASARSDVGSPLPTTDHAGACQLHRVGTQFVRCDNLTGNGVAAPAWISRADSNTPGKSVPRPHAGRRPSLARSRTVDFATFDAHVAVAVSDRFTLDPDATLLPGDVRVWELNHPAGATYALLPGDLRHRERGSRADLAAPAK